MTSQTSLLTGLGIKYPGSKLLFDDTFDSGFCGWDALMDSTTPRPPVSLTSKHPFSGSHALKFGTGAVYNTVKEGYGVAIKRLTRLHDTGVVNFDAWWAFGSTDWPNAPQSIEFGMDTQYRDGSARTFPKHRWQIVNPSDGSTGYYQWAVKKDDLSYVNVTGSPTADGVYAHPYNENKENLIYTRFRYDLAAGYLGMWIYDDFYDLTGLGAGTGSESTVTNYNGGMNFYVGINNRGSSHGAQAWVILGRVRAWYE